jgi:hypothetical protein
MTTDIDATWDPEKGSLHDHRMKQMETMKQPGWPPKPEVQTPPADTPVFDDTAEDDAE